MLWIARKLDSLLSSFLSYGVFHIVAVNSKDAEQVGYRNDIDDQDKADNQSKVWKLEPFCNLELSIADMLKLCLTEMDGAGNERGEVRNWLYKQI